MTEPTTEELVAQVRAGLGDTSNALVPNTMTETAFDGLTALTTLHERLRAAGQEKWSERGVMLDLQDRAETAEQRLGELEEALQEQKIRSILARLDDAKVVGAIFDHSREALESAYAEFERAEEHHRWHHEQEGRAVEEDDERLRVLMIIAEALEELPESLPQDVEQQTEHLREQAAALSEERP